MSWEKMRKALSRCTECGECEQYCSIFLTMGDHSAHQKLQIIGELMEGRELTDEEINSVFMCTKCEACQEVCPQEIPTIEIFDWARHAIQSKYGFRNKKQQILVQNILHYGNPFGETTSRLLDVPAPAERIVHKEEVIPPSSTLLHLGCMLAYRFADMRDDLLEIFNLLEIDYTLLEEEKCCGYFIWNTGDHHSAEKVIQENARIFDQYDRIICACAGCYTFFKQNYPHPEKFYHNIEIINEKLKELNIASLKEKGEHDCVIFHDSCHLTRPHGIIEPPREVLRQIGYELEEFPLSGKEGLCCGADGGMRIVNPELALTMGNARLNQLKEHQDLPFLTLCPFCIFNFRECVSEEEPWKIGSLYQYIRQYLEKAL